MRPPSRLASRPKPCLGLLLLAAFAVPLHAALEFETTTISLKPALGATQIEARFPFKNTGDTPVTVTAVRSGCGCTVPEKPSAPIEPGASGVIPVVFKPAGKQGPQNQAIHLETDDGTTHELRLQIDLPVRVSFAPRLLVFRGAESETKTATLTFHPDSRPELLEVLNQSPAFEILGQPGIDEKGLLQLAFRHIGEAGGEARASVRVRTRDASGQEHTDLLYLRHLP